MEATALCRSCLAAFEGAGRCPSCGSPRTLSHTELNSLSIAHLDCDAFYASVEKHDDPSLRDRPVIVGGGVRGVVTTACYIARIAGVRSAMPMFKALKLCPEAVVVRPRMDRYVEISREIRALMLDLTPQIEPLSLDEAFLDLNGTERLHRAPPALLMARLQTRIEHDLGLTVSIGLSHNKFLAKIASETDKPRGFTIIGRAETMDFLRDKPIGVIWGVGPQTVAKLRSEGLQTVLDIRSRDRQSLMRSFGMLGDRLWRLAHGEDARAVTASREVKSISNETTFSRDLADLDALRPVLWGLTETVSARLKARSLMGKTVTLKLKRTDHGVLTRQTKLESPTFIAERLYGAAVAMLQRDISSGPFRLIGIGASTLTESTKGGDELDFFDERRAKRLEAEKVSDAIRARFGARAIGFGRGLRS
jgi:DNA polymerase IV